MSKKSSAIEAITTISFATIWGVRLYQKIAKAKRSRSLSTSGKVVLGLTAVVAVGNGYFAAQSVKSLFSK